MLRGRLQEAFVRCLEVFELVEDVDKVTKVLVNLANMCAIQVGGSSSSGGSRPRESPASVRLSVCALDCGT